MTSKQRAYLRGLANTMEPILHAGKGGISDAMIKQADDALEAIAEEALARNTGARGLRAIMENLMLSTMYEVPARKDIAEVQITAEAVNGTQKPKYILLRDLERVIEEA